MTPSERAKFIQEAKQVAVELNSLAERAGELLDLLRNARSGIRRGFRTGLISDRLICDIVDVDSSTFSKQMSGKKPLPEADLIGYARALLEDERVVKILDDYRKGGGK